MSSERERGAALLTVLLLVAVIAVMAAAGLEKLRLATRLGGNAVALEQARAYAQAAETLATTHITALLRQDGGVRRMQAEGLSPMAGIASISTVSSRMGRTVAIPLTRRRSTSSRG